MNTNELFPANRVVNYLLLNNKFPIVIIFILCTLIRAYWWFGQLLNNNNAICHPEIMGGSIGIVTYSILTTFSVIYFNQKGTRQLKKLFSITNKTIQTLKSNFQTTISINLQRIIVKYSFIIFTIYAIIFSTYEIRSFLKRKPEIGMFTTAIFELVSVSFMLQNEWIWLMTFIELILLNILGNQLQAMVHIVSKWDYQYGNLWVEIYRQSKLINNVFEVVTLAIIIDIILSIWSASEPNASCIMNDYQFMLIVCCGWTIAIVESGQHVNRKVRKFWHLR